MIKIKYSIMDDIWIFNVMSEKSFQRKHKDRKDAAALTIPSLKTVDFIEDELSRDILKHELFHVNVSYLCLEDTTNMTVDDYEEIFAVFYVNNEKKMKRQLKEIWKEIRKHVRRAKEKRRSNNIEGGEEGR